MEAETCVRNVTLFQWTLACVARPVCTHFPVLNIYACLPMARWVATLAQYITQSGNCGCSRMKKAHNIMENEQHTHTVFVSGKWPVAKCRHECEYNIKLRDRRLRQWLN